MTLCRAEHEAPLTTARGIWSLCVRASVCESGMFLLFATVRGSCLWSLRITYYRRCCYNVCVCVCLRKVNYTKTDLIFHTQNLRFYMKSNRSVFIISNDFKCQKTIVRCLLSFPCFSSLYISSLCAAGRFVSSYETTSDTGQKSLCSIITWENASCICQTLSVILSDIAAVKLLWAPRLLLSRLLLNVTWKVTITGCCCSVVVYCCISLYIGLCDTPFIRNYILYRDKETNLILNSI